jgi:hypothetical protein
VALLGQLIIFGIRIYGNIGQMGVSEKNGDLALTS